MRYHREWSLFQAWSNSKYLQDVISSENIIVSRLEPIIRNGVKQVMLDLRFSNVLAGISVPCIYVDEAALLHHLNDVLIWPYAISSRISDDRLYEIEKILLDWLYVEINAKGLSKSSEYVWQKGASSDLYYKAKSSNLFAASSTNKILNELSIAHYAYKFCIAKQVVVDPELANVAAIVAQGASEIIIPCEDSQLETFRSWFLWNPQASLTNPDSTFIAIGAAAIKATEASSKRMTITAGANDVGNTVSFIPPVMLDDLASFFEDRKESHHLTIDVGEMLTEQVIPSQPAALGGSNGKIVLYLRSDAYSAPSADLDEAEALKVLLEAEGFKTVILCAPIREEIADAGVVHIIGLSDAQSVNTITEWAKYSGIPVIITPFFEDSALGGRWGAKASRSLLGQVREESEIDRALRALAHRKVEVDGIDANTRYDDGQDGLRRELLRRADVVTVVSQTEKEAVQRFSGRRRRIVEAFPLVYSSKHSRSTNHIMPAVPFVLIHSNIEANCNVELLMRALRSLEFATMLVGRINDRRLYRTLVSNLHPSSVIVPEISEPELQNLYERATVYADLAWIGEGFHRIAHALLSGAEVVVANTRHTPESLESFITRVDPASEKDIEAGITEAWQRALGANKSRYKDRIHTLLDPANAFRAYIAAYAQANDRSSKEVVTAR